ncbi:hypothetical protein DSO57_1032318 [Entomophthora muscae]|uniref:Uncharacterized protein n=1 Tax=Entomophthora muscae TaxID=34485 RepID=A0ACC2TMS9_9FUNG|nr:hypothetical protein DSO57_1032318 [Entomophthora muscae]
MKITPDRYLSRLQACTCPADAVTLFKRLYKTVTSSALLSRDPGINATEDAALYFEGVFAQTDVTLRGVSFLSSSVMVPRVLRLLNSSALLMYADTSNSIHLQSLVDQIQCMCAFLRLFFCPV